VTGVQTCALPIFVLSLPWELRPIVLNNRREGLNLMFQAAIASVQQWAHDVMKFRMGIIAVLHTFGSDLKWHPHIHMIVTGGGLTLDGKKWIATRPSYLMNHKGLKTRWKYHVSIRMKKIAKKGGWRFPKADAYLKDYPRFASIVNKLWNTTWYAFIGASLIDPSHSVRYIGRYTKRAVLAEYRITAYDGKIVRFSYKDYAEGGKIRYKTLSVNAFIARLVRHVPDNNFQMIRHAGLFANRWKAGYLAQARAALNQPEPQEVPPSPTWAERQKEYTGRDPLLCPVCNIPMEFRGLAFGSWKSIQEIFRQAGRDPTIPSLLLRKESG
jgi:hypothetical protein